MLKLPLLGCLLLLASSAFAGVATCPDNTYLVFPIPGVTGGTASSCGNATVGGTSVFAATPGGGSVPVDVLASYLKYDINSLFDPDFFSAGEGSAALLAGFTLSTAATVSFNWTGEFEPEATGALFYILNGQVTVLDARYPFIGLPCGQDCPISPCDALCATDVPSNQVTLNLPAGSHTLGFGAVTINNKLIPVNTLDPAITVTNFSVAANDVPEPATVGLTGVALLGLAAWRQRRRA